MWPLQYDSREEVKMHRCAYNKHKINVNDSKSPLVTFASLPIAPRPHLHYRLSPGAKITCLHTCASPHTVNCRAWTMTDSFFSPWFLGLSQNSIVATRDWAGRCEGNVTAQWCQSTQKSGGCRSGTDTFPSGLSLGWEFVMLLRPSEFYSTKALCDE